MQGSVLMIVDQLFIPMALGPMQWLLITWPTMLRQAEDLQ
jgi:hypothetical protein